MVTLKQVLFICSLFSILSVSCKKTEVSDIIVVSELQAKVFRVVSSLDENNQPKDYSWGLSVNEEYINSDDTPLDDNVLVPLNLPDEFRIPNLKVLITGKKYPNENHAMTLPGIRPGFGYSFELIKIKIDK
jgi:hypothetical protein